jgi:hypothetical protein
VVSGESLGVVRGVTMGEFLGVIKGDPEGEAKLRSGVVGTHMAFDIVEEDKKQKGYYSAIN